MFKFSSNNFIFTPFYIEKLGIGTASQSSTAEEDDVVPPSPILTQKEYHTPPAPRRQKEVAFKKPPPGLVSLNSPLSDSSSSRDPPTVTKKPSEGFKSPSPRTLPARVEEEKKLSASTQPLTGIRKKPVRPPPDEIIEEVEVRDENMDKDEENVKNGGGDDDDDELGEEEENSEDGDDEGEGEDQDDDESRDPEWSQQEEYETSNQTARRFKELKLKAKNECAEIKDYMEVMKEQIQNTANKERAQMLTNRMAVLEQIRAISDADMHNFDIG